MAKSKDKMVFEERGIGAVLAQNMLRVPLNQREYSWEAEHVLDLFQDFAGKVGKSDYFLGTLVLTRTPDGGLEVADGQQRLATTSILLASIRDYFVANNESGRARSIDECLLTNDLHTGEVVPRLSLNVDDHEFFRRFVIDNRDPSGKPVEPSKGSHRLIAQASELAKKHVADIVVQYKPTDRWKALVEWVEFIKKDAIVVVLTVPDHINAFVMFETLNDRGLKASQADLLKNHLLGELKDTRLKEGQQSWAKMIGSLDSLGIPDLAVTYLRHIIICRNGPTKERELLEKVKKEITSAQKAITFLDELAESANRYTALFNPDHANWNGYGEIARGNVRTMLDLDVQQIRPLMFAVLREFPVVEAKKALQLFVAWSVRFLVAGGRGGLLDSHYALRAQEVSSGKIKTAKQLVAAMADIVPPDATFQTAFAEARVSRSVLARYYLRAMERAEKGEADPHFIPNPEEVINLEHILPEVPGDGWGHIDPEVAEAQYRRIGNLCLLQAKGNVELGNRSFGEKKKFYKDCPYLLTREVAELTRWDPPEISNRQKRLAKLAVRTWPITVG